MGKLERSVKNIYFQYAILFFAAVLIIFLPYFQEGKSFISRYDALQQHIVAIKSIKEILKEFFSGRFTISDFWSWNLGIGADQFQIYSYYGMGDIFTYLGLIFKNYDTSFMIIMLTKLFVAGLGITLFLNSKKIFSNKAILVGTAVYLFCGYIIHSATSHPMFLTPMVILPFFLWSIDRLFKKKDSFLISIILCWALMSNFYFAVFVILAGAVYFFMLLLESKLDCRKKIFMLFNVMLKLLMGIGLSAVFFIPTVYAFLHSTRAEVPFANGIWVYPLKFYVNFFNTFLTPPQNRSFEFHGGYAVIVIPSVIYVFLNFKKYKKICISLLMLSFGFITPIFAALVNGMSTPSLRWEFLLGIPLAFATATFIESISRVTHNQFVLISILSLVFVLLANFSTGLTRQVDSFLPILLVFLVVILLLVFPYKKEFIRIRSYLILIIVFGNVIFNGLYYNSSLGANYVSTHIDKGTLDKYYDDYLVGLSDEMRSLIGGNEFTRFSFTRQVHNPTLGAAIDNRSNVGAWQELPMVNSYFSLQNENIGEFSKYYENSDMVMTEPLRSLDNRTILSNYLGIKYLISRNKEDVPPGYKLIKEENFDNQPIYIFESENSLPLLFGVDKVYDSENTQNGITREQNLANSVAIDRNANKSIFSRYQMTKKENSRISEIPSEITRDESVITIVPKQDINQSSGEYFLYIEKPEVVYRSSLSKIFEEHSEPQKEKTSVIDRIKVESKEKPSGTTIQILQDDKLLNLKYLYGRHEPSSYVSPQNLLFKIGDTETMVLKDNKLYVKIFSSNPTNIGSITLLKSTVDKRTFADLEMLKNDALQNIQVDNGKIEAIASFPEKKLVASSIPYSPGWSVNIDGVKSETFIANKGFLGFELSSGGKHNIVITYRTPLLFESFVVTILSFLCIIVYRKYSTMYKRKH